MIEAMHQGYPVDEHDCKTVLLGVTGCIAAYKSCEIVRELQKSNVRVKVVMTPHACEFVGPTTFRALTREPVAVDLFDDPGDPIHHVSLAKECDAFLIAPCTANVLAKIAHGIADDLLTTTALATKAPLILACAMNDGMYENEATQANIRTVRSRGIRVIEPDDGYLACGDSGRGRLADIDVILAETIKAIDRRTDLAGMHILVTAGPTQEAIDPVRFVSNRSSGKMGYAIADAASSRGAHVTLISGPTSLFAPPSVDVRRVETAQQMLEAVDLRFSDADIAIFSAAVADSAPVDPADRKLKKGIDDEALATVELKPTPDILATCSAAARDDQVVVGFAAETNNLVENARSKLERKGCDIIVANEVGPHMGFGTDDDKAWIVMGDREEELPLMAKRDLADFILDYAAALARTKAR